MDLEFRWMLDDVPVGDLPSKSSEDVGYDMKLVRKVGVNYEGNSCYTTGWAVRFPVGYYGLVYLRSSIGKTEYSLGNAVGVIDPGYRGEIKVNIRGSGVPNMDKPFIQLVIIRLPPNFDVKINTEPLESWINTSRGVGGFGSTDKVMVDWCGTR